MKTKIAFKERNLTVEVEKGTSLLHAARLAGVELEADCKGMGRCGKCRVIAVGGLSLLTPCERDLLTPPGNTRRGAACLPHLGDRTGRSRSASPSRGQGQHP